MANEVFISYSRRNYGQVYKIKEEIDRKVGIDCWMDIDGIESGEQFLKVIVSAINRHDTFLFMLDVNPSGGYLNQRSANSRATDLMGLY